ncbi:hypothetical protein WMY93_027194 [Mugilogobius chulae]|uniref:Interleukin 17 n=1 Tax=Mugilogobius chulae TaxID=88201 RepID=A0AAW0MU02_9GOBI
MDATTALLCLLGMAGVMSAYPLNNDTSENSLNNLNSAPVSCGHNCKVTNHPVKLHFSHVRDLENISIAPWTLRTNTDFPEPFLEAVCKPCNQTHLKSMPIHLQIYVTKPVRTGGAQYCKCSYKLAVGCTCVPKTTSQNA